MKTSKKILDNEIVAIEDKAKLDDLLCFALYSTSLTMSKVYKPLLTKLKITYPQYVVLLALWEKDDVMVSELGNRVFLDSGTLTPLLKRLETLGLVKRTRATEDERRVLIKLTTKGQDLQKQTSKVRESIQNAVQCTAEEAKKLASNLQKLRKALLVSS